MIFDVLLNLSGEDLTTCQSVRIECKSYEELFLKITRVLDFFDGVVSSITITQYAKRERPIKIERRPRDEY